MHIGELVRRNAVTRGTAPALTGRQGTFTWTEVNDRVNRLANALTDQGLVTGDRVAILAHNDSRYYEVSFACAKTGLVLVPINYRLSPQTVATIDADCQPAMWIHEDDTAALVPESATRRIRLSGAPRNALDYEQLLDASSGAEPRAAAPDALAVIGYTSGTTGQPKGAMLLTEERVLSALEFCLVMKIDEHTIFLSCMPAYVHRGGSGSLAAAVAGGHTIVEDFAPTGILTTIERHRPTMIMLAPAMINALLAHPDIRARDLTSLRTLWTTGAPSSPDAIRQLQALLPDCTIGSSYGMTEATGIANCQFDPTLPDELFQRRLHAAGLPMPLMAVRLLNGRGADVPTGEVGEVHVRGATMMSGYWEDPELTASTMTDGWFNTGDVGRFDEDGYLYLVDRSVDIINSGGLNIYSAEVERVLLGHPAVAEAAVVSAPHERWGEQVCAFIVTQPETAVTAEALISYCGAELGSFKKPGMVRFCPSLPRNEMGKVHKSELRGLNWVGTGATIGPRRNVDRSR